MFEILNSVLKDCVTTEFYVHKEYLPLKFFLYTHIFLG